MQLETQIQALTSLSGWSYNPSNEELLGAHSKTVQKKLRHSKLLAHRISSSSKLKPTVGIYGPSQAGKSYLTAKFAENVNGILSVQLDQQYDFLRQINPPGGRESTALVSRFTRDVTSSNQQFPIKAKLLCEADIVCILANSYFCDNGEPVYPDTDTISDILTEVGRSTQSAKNSNKIDDALQIEHYLDQKVFPREIRERFSGLWEIIETIYVSKNLEQRARVYSLLWNFNSHFSKLFWALAGPLESFKNKDEILLPISSLLPRDKSIIDVTILKDLGNEASDKETVLCDNKQVTLRKSVISALISELYLSIDSPSRSVFESADLLDFPGARTRFSKSIKSVEEDGVHEFFLRGKIDYLFHKFTIDLAIDALIFCIDPGPLNIRELPNALEDWIELSEYENNSQNSKLFFALTKFDTHFPDAAGNQNDEEQRFENAVDSGLIQPFVRSQESWPVNWKAKKFKNVFPIRNPNYPLAGYFRYKMGREIDIVSEQIDRFEELKMGFLRAPLVQEHMGDREGKWKDLVAVDGGGANYLASAIEVLDLQTLKNQNLDHQMSVNAQTVSDTLSIFIHTDDKREKLRVELEKFKSLYKQIYNIGKSGKFPTLLRSLSVSEELVSSAINLAIKTTNEETLDNDQIVETEEWIPDILKDSDGTDRPDETNIMETSIQKSSSVRIADALLTAWVNSLTSGYDNTKVMRLLNTNMAAFEFLTGHIANETQISRIRKILETKFDSWTYGETLDANLTTYAKIASETINQHILLRVKTEDKNSVSSETISEFSRATLTEPLELWKSWISSFGETIKTNCSSSGQSSFDPIQNDVLVASLNELQLA